MSTRFAIPLSTEETAVLIGQPLLVRAGHYRTGRQGGVASGRHSPGVWAWGCRYIREAKIVRAASSTLAW